MNRKDILTRKSLQLTVTGLVQGVGFRPFIYRIATKFDLTGWVQNTNENVRILVTGPPENINSFLFSLKNETPWSALIDRISR